MKKREDVRVLLICSAGGHFTQLYALQEYWKKYDCIWVTENKTDTCTALDGQEVIFANFPVSRNIKNLIKNAFLATKIVLRRRPDLIVSNGSGVAIPFFILGRVLGIKTIYIEVIDRIKSASVTGRFCYPFSNLFVVQWKEQLEFYPKAILIGPVL